MYIQDSLSNRRIVIALGDPAGIGIEVTLKALGSKNLPSEIQPLLVGCKKSLKLIHSQLLAKGVNTLPNLNQIEIDDMPLKSKLIPGKPNLNTGEASFRWLTKASKYLINNQARALVTAPICKASWHKAGHRYPGQTERLAELSGSTDSSMLFTAVSPNTGWRLNTLLATTHIPLKEITKHLTPQLINSKLNILLDFCQRYKKNPKIAVAGLNPHAGEEGKIGDEEVEWLIPTLMKWQAEHPKIKLFGPLSPDSCWITQAKAWQNSDFKNIADGVLALYHDQGLIPIKLIAFEQAVNTTLGLQFIRTSPDHGTGFDIAGNYCADEESMICAIKTAWDLTKNNI